MSNRRNLTTRINQLERTLGSLPCHCHNNSDLSWPGHQPELHCDTCGGKRLIYPLPHHPHHTETTIRQALPILQKAYGSNQRADLRKLTDHELHQLKTALQAADDARPPTHVANVNA